MNPSEVTNVIGLVLLGGFILASLVAMLTRENKLYDEKDSSVVWLNQLASVSQLEPAKKFSLKIMRQSGNEQQPERHYCADDQSYVQPSAVIEEALKTFRRANIEGVVILENGTRRFDFARMWHDHRGVKEGKKVERAVIVSLD